MHLSQCDQIAYQAYAGARKLPPGPDRDETVAAALRRACEVPLEVLQTARAALQHAARTEVRGSIRVDVRIAAHLLLAAARSARETLAANLAGRAAAGFRADLTARSEELMHEIVEAAAPLVGSA
jgi:formiminotetrahydrofolate cyclodeaminase